MNDEEQQDVVMLDGPVVYVEAEEIVDEDVGFDEKTAQYVLAQVEDDYDEMIVIDQIELDEFIDDDGEVVSLAELRLVTDERDERDLEVA